MIFCDKPPFDVCMIIADVIYDHFNHLALVEIKLTQLIAFIVYKNLEYLKFYIVSRYISDLVSTSKVFKVFLKVL